MVGYNIIHVHVGLDTAKRLVKEAIVYPITGVCVCVCVLINMYMYTVTMHVPTVVYWYSVSTHLHCTIVSSILVSAVLY